MNDKVQSEYASVLVRIARLEEELTVHRHAKELLEKVGAVAPSGAPSPEAYAALASGPEAKRSKRRRAPSGYLEAEIAKILKGNKDGLTNAELRDRLTAGRYKYSLTPAHISRSLGNMVEAGKLKSTKKGTVGIYRLP